MPRRLLPLALAGLALAVPAIPAAPAAAQTGDPGFDYQFKIWDKYANLRRELVSCHIAKANGTLDKEGLEECRKLVRRYTIFSFPGEAEPLFIHCNTPKCITAPVEAPSARAPYPAGAKLWRWNK